MKKLILSFLAVAVLSGCAYTHYKKEESYVQSGHDCIVKNAEWGIVDRNDKDAKSRVVYPNTACAELMGKKTAPQKTTITIHSVKRVYMRNNCKASYGTWCK